MFFKNSGTGKIITKIGNFCDMGVCQKSIIESKAIFIDNSDKAIAREKLEESKNTYVSSGVCEAIFYKCVCIKIWTVDKI